jgi:hypothetical protein
MKHFKTFMLLLFAVFISIATGVAGASVGINPYLVGGVTLSASIIPKGSIGLFAGINVEIWQNFVVENLYKNNQFIERSVDVSDFVINGSVVHIPNAGVASDVERNRQVLPAPIKRRGDTDVVYVLDEFTTNPVAILRADQLELSYDKMNSVLANDMANIRQSMAEWMLYNWRPEGTANMVLTTGSSVAAHLSGATGNRKAFKLADLRKAATLMNAANLPMEGRVALFDAYMYEQLLEDLSPTQYRDFSSYMNVEEGIVGRLFGFDIMQRSTVLRLSTSNVVKEPSAAAATTDKAGVLCWQETQVEKAVGNVDAYEDLKNPTMYGDIYSFALRAGGSKRRGSKIGTIAIVQDAA